MVRQYKRSTPKPKPAATWIVVADAGQARILKAEAEDGVLEEIECLTNPDARLQPHEAQSDRDGSAPGPGSAFEPRQDYKTHVAEAFAKRIATYLGKARRDGSVGRLYLVANPSFLGHLRAELDQPTRRVVVQEVGGDLVRRKPADIRHVLPARL